MPGGQGQWTKLNVGGSGGAVTQPFIGNVTGITAAAPVPVVVSGKTVAKITITATAPVTAQFGSGDTLFAGVEVALSVPGSVSDQGWERPAGIAAGVSFSFDLIVPYPVASESWTVYLRARSEKFINPLVLSGGSATPNIVIAMVPLSLTAPPNVTLFSAGKSNGDGTFAANMYWDSLAKNMLVDWACLAPTDRSNWSGVQIWLKTPDGLGGFAYSPATGILGIDQFSLSGTTDYVHYDTIAIEPQFIPVPPQSWDFIAVSAGTDANQTLNTSGGHPAGVTVTLSTLAKSDLVTGFTATVSYGLSEAGDQQFSLSGSWTNPTPPRYKGVRVFLHGFLTPTSDQALADASDGDSSFHTDWYPVPDTAKSVIVYATPLFGDNTNGAIVPGTTPSVALTIQRQAGVTSTEFTSLVTGFSCGTPFYDFDAGGQQTLYFDVFFTPPAVATFGGVILKMIRGGVTYVLTGLEPSSPVHIAIHNFPSANDTTTVYALSVSTNNQINTYVPGTTPAATVVLPPPAGVSPGSGFSVAYAYVKLPATGQTVLQLTPTFTKPTGPQFGWYDFWAKREDSNWYLLGSPDQGGIPGIATLNTLPNVSFTWSFLLIAKDVNGKDANGNSSTNPVSPPAGSLNTTLLIDPVKTNSPLGQVTGFSVAASYSVPDANGARNLLLVPTFTKPADPTWAYIQFWAKREDGNWYLLGYPGAGGVAGLATLAQLPKVLFTWSFLAVSVNANNQDLNGNTTTDPTAPPAGTPTFSLAIGPPALGNVGVEYTSDVTFDPTFNSGAPATTTLTRADGTSQFQVQVKVVLPVDSTFGGYDIVTMTENVSTGALDLTSIQTTRGTFKGVDGIYQTNIPASAVRQALFLVSYDMNGRRNTVNATEMSLGGTLTPRADISFGILTGILDLGKALGSSYTNTEFVLSGGKLTINGLDFTKVIGTTISSELAVSGGVFGVASLSAAKITAGTLVAGVVYAGSIAATQILAGTLVAGVIYTGTINCSQLNAGTLNAVNMVGGTFVLNSAGFTTTINNSTYGLQVKQNASNLGSFIGMSVLQNTNSTGNTTCQIDSSGSSSGGRLTLNSGAGVSNIQMDGGSAVITCLGTITATVSVSSDIVLASSQLHLGGGVSAGSPASAATWKIPIWNAAGTFLNYLYLYP